MQKWQERQNWGKAAKQTILLLAGTVLNEAANIMNEGGTGKKKREKIRRSIVNKAISGAKKTMHSNTEAAFDFYTEDEYNKSCKYNYLMEGLLNESDYFEPNQMKLSVMGDYDRRFGTCHQL